MKSVTIKWDATDEDSPKIYSLFKVTAKAMGLTLFQANIQALKEYNLTHREQVKEFIYQVPDTTK